ncbi:MAG: hypothetical protein LBN22_11215, partial [Clostridiales Family XIII bacterium]|nr:hypothetical protein [Clostridiales Family XIII bacterium]
FLNKIDSSNKEGKEFFLPKDQLPKNTGACKVTIAFTDGIKKNILKVTSVATYQGRTKVVSLTLKHKAESTNGLFPHPTSKLDPSKRYGNIVDNINTGQNGFETDKNPVNIAFGASNGPAIPGASANTSQIKKYNQENRTRRYSVIGHPESQREATWMETVDIGGSNTVSGPRDLPAIDQAGRNATTDKGPIAQMRLLAPMNGKMTINPISAGDVAANFSHEVGKVGNVKVNQFSIIDTQSKSVKLRLGNTGTGERTSGTPKYAYLGLDFYDNYSSSNSSAQVAAVPGIYDEDIQIIDPENTSSGWSSDFIRNGLAFYPNNWADGTIYLKNSKEESIPSELLFGPYGQIYNSDELDWRNWANYVTHHWGEKQRYRNHVVAGLDVTNPANALQENLGKSGFAFPPVYWGNNFSMYLLDGPHTTEAARIMQGVNIVNKTSSDGSLAGGVIYSNRSLKIGGTLTCKGSGSGVTFDGPASKMRGFIGDRGQASLAVVQATYHQVIQDTDIVLMSDGNEVKKSEILHPEGIGQNGYSTLTIKGGTIYVGNNHELTIDSEIQDGLVVKGEVGPDGFTPIGGERGGGSQDFYNYESDENHMNIMPKEIVVAAGGTLTIKRNINDRANIETDIYVDGGILNIETAAHIKGNIYVYNGGKVNLKDMMELDKLGNTDSPASGGGGIYVYGSDAVNGFGFKAGGKINFKDAVGAKLWGTSGRIHLLGDFKELLTVGDAASVPDTLPHGKYADDYLCNCHDAETGECKHFKMSPPGSGGAGTTEGGTWTMGEYASK